MSTPFLTRFSDALVRRLLEAELLEVQPGARDQVVRHLAGALSAARPHSSLLSSVEQALLACPEVVEVYVDLEGLKSIVDDLRS